MTIFTQIISCRKSNKNFLSAALLLLILVSSTSFGQASITSSSAVTDALASYAGTSTFPTNWTLSYTGGTNYNGTTQTTGTTGGWYGNANISFLGSGSASNGNATWLLQNNSGSTITGFTLSFTARLWKTGTASPNVTVSYTNSASSSNPAAGALANSLSSLTFNDATANVSTGTTLQQTVSSLSIASGQYIFIRFIHAGGSNSDNLGWDDLSFTPTLQPTFTSTAGGGLWNATGSWVGGVVPTAGATVNIVGPITINNTTGQIANSGIININSSGTLLCGYTSGASLTGTGTVNVNGTGILDIEQGGWPGTTNSYNYGNVTAGTGTLKFNNSSGSYGVNSGDNWFPATITNVNVAGAGGITLNSAHTISGSFQSSATVVNPGNITANGTLQLNSGYGWSGTGNPIYGASSLLQYNSGGSPGRAAEWTATGGTIGTTAGYPNNVQVSNNTTLNYANGGTSNYKANGTVTVDAGSSLYQNFGGGNAGLVVGSDAIINGNITLGTSSGDLFVAGNLTVGSAANFSANGRGVTFNGTGTQTITKTGAGTVAFDYFIIDKTAGSVVLNSSPATDVTVNASSGNVLQLINTGGLDLNGRTMTFNNSGGGIFVNAARTINSTVAGGSLAFTNYKFVANNAGTGSLTLAANITVNLNANGNLDFGKSGSTYITTLNGTLSINSTTSCFVNTNPPIYGSASLLKYNSGGTYGRGLEWSTTTGAGYPNDVQVTSSTTLNYPNTGASAFTTNLALARDLTIDTGSSLYMDYGSSANKSGALAVGRNISLSGNLSLGDAVGGDLSVAGTWTLSGGTFTPNQRAVQFNGASAQSITGATTFDYLTLNNSTGLTLNNSIVVNQTLALTSGKITLGANNLTVGSAGTITGASTTNYVIAASTGQLKRTVGGTATLFAVGNTAYNPITFTNSGTSDVYGVRVANTAPAGANNTKTVTRQWITTEAVAGGSTLTVVAQYNTGETGAGFAAATDYFIGHYNGTAYSQQAASTVAGANPFTVTTNTALSPADLTTGTQYFAIGKDNGLLSVPSKYVLSAITPSSPTAGSGFSVTVTAQDNYGSNTTLSSSSTFALTTNGNAGTISGTTTGTIASGTSSIVVTGVILPSAGTNVTLTATNTSGVSLTAGTSATFTVLAPANQLAFVGVPSTGNAGVNLTSFTVEARRPDGTTVDNTYTGNITISKATGSGTLSGTLTVAAVAGVATFSAAQFDLADTYTLNANSGSFPQITSGNIVITYTPVSIFANTITGTNPGLTSPYTTGQTFDSHITVGGISRGSGVTGTSANDRYNANAWSTTTFDSTDYFEFTLTPATGYQINFSSFVYNAQVSTGTPTLNFRSSVDNYTANIGTPSTSGTTISLSGAAYQNIAGPITFRMYGFGFAAAGTTFSINDFIFNGNVVCIQPTAYSVTGGGAYCTGGSGVAVGLANSQSGISYQLKIGGTNTGSPVAGTGSAITFGNQTTAGTYTVVATNGNTPCNYSANMTGSVSVTVTPTNTVGSASSTPTLCVNTALTNITHSTTGATGIGTATGLPAGVTASWASNTITISGTPTASGNFSYSIPLTGGCGSVNATGTINVNSASTAAVISGGAAICSGTSTNLEVTITGGTSPYTVVYTGGTLNSYTSGSNIPVSPSSTTNYTITSVTDANGCLGTGNSGSASVTLTTTTTTDGGSTWDNGTPSNTKAIVFNGGTGTISADVSGCSLRLTNNATVTVASTTDVNLSGALTVDSGSTFTLNNNANLLQGGTTNSNSGNIIVKRNSSALKRLDYTLWSSPVAGQEVYAFSPSTFANRFYVYNSNTNLYNNAAVGMNVSGLDPNGVNGTDGNHVQFAQAKGYLIRMPWDHPTAATIWNGQFTGVPNNGDITYTMTNGGAGQRFNLVGNPYPSAISMTQFVSDNSTKITGTLYFWRETNGTTANNAYCSWAGGTFVSNNQAQVVDPNGIIRTGQGFFVEASGAATTVDFKNGQRSGDNANQFFRTANNVVNDVETNRFWLNLSNAAGEFSQMAAGYMTDATNEVDIYDGKNINTGSVLLNSILDNTDYTIQGKALPFNASDVIPLSCKITNAGEYTIAIDHVDGLFTDATQSIYLKDNLTNTEHDLQTGAYTFASDAGTFTNRFEIIYQSQLANPTFTPNSVVIYNQHNDFVINSGNTIMKSVKVFDIRGRLLQEKKDINASQAIITSGLSNEVLLVQITSVDGAVVTKKVIR